MASPFNKRKASGDGKSEPFDHEGQGRQLNDELHVAKKRLTAQGSFNVEFWTNAGEVERILLQRTEVDRKISLRDFKGTQAEWEKTENAKTLPEQLHAQQAKMKLCNERVKTLKGPRRRLRACFMKLFTTSKMGIGIKDTGAGKRSRDAQKIFKEKIIEVYGSKHPSHRSRLWCPILGEWLPSETLRAAHLFAYMHGQDTMDAIFGPQREPELFSPKNGLLVYSEIEKVFDMGIIAIVPDLPDVSGCTDILAWVTSEVRDYKIRVLDHDYQHLDEELFPRLPTTLRSLDNRRLQFLTLYRPAARYVYFHYCIQVLRRAWQMNAEGNSKEVLLAKNKKVFWGTPGRYLPENMLLALVEELGHDYKDLLKGAKSSSGQNDLLMNVAISQIQSRHRRPRNYLDEDKEDDEDSTEDEDSEG